MRRNAIRRWSERNLNDQRIYGVSASRNRAAAGLMLGYVVLTSFAPLFVSYGGGDSPFIFNAAWELGSMTGYALILPALFRRTLFSGEVWKSVRSRALDPAMLLWVVGSFALGLYAWSTQYIDVSIAAALYETWPIFFVALAGWLFRLEARYRKITAKAVFLFGAAVLGIASVIASEAGEIGAFISADARRGANPAMGVALALGSVGLVALTAYGFRWTADLAANLSEPPGDRARDRDSLELLCALIGLVVVDLFSVPSIAATGLIRNEAISSDALIYGAAGGLFAGAVGTIFWRMANSVAANLEINVMNYLIPALALGWLFAFSRVGEVAVGYLLFGVAAIIFANIGMYFETRGA